MGKCILGFLLVCFVVPVLAQDLEQQSGSVVYLQEKEQQFIDLNNGQRVRRKSRNLATGFLVASEHPLNLFPVTAQHVALDMKSQRTETIRGDNDTPINMKLEDLVGERDVRWVFHDKEDVAVVILRPTGITTAALKGHFMPIRMLVSEPFS